MMLPLLILWLMAGGIIAWLVEKVNASLSKWIAFIALAAAFGMTLAWWMQMNTSGGLNVWLMQYDTPWIPDFGIHFHLALDGLSLLMQWTNADRMRFHFGCIGQQCEAFVKKRRRPGPILNIVRDKFRASPESNDLEVGAVFSRRNSNRVLLRLVDVNEGHWGISFATNVEKLSGLTEALFRRRLPLNDFATGAVCGV